MSQRICAVEHEVCSPLPSLQGQANMSCTDKRAADTLYEKLRRQCSSEPIMSKFDKDR